MLVVVFQQSARVVGAHEAEVLAQAGEEGVALLDQQIAAGDIDEGLVAVSRLPEARSVVSI